MHKKIEEGNHTFMCPWKPDNYNMHSHTVLHVPPEYPTTCTLQGIYWILETTGPCTLHAKGM